MIWHRVRLTVAQAVGARHIEIQNDFNELFLRLGRPKDMAMFSLVAEAQFLELYFTPATPEDLLKRVHARPCDRPQQEVALAAGDAAALERFRSGEFG